MRRKKAPRKLLVLNVNDLHNQISVQNNQDFVIIKNINSYKAAQGLLLDSILTGTEHSGDLFLIDVNFQQSEFPRGLQWGSSSTIRPFGPLLALPFVGREICTFVPYSNYWGDSDVSKNGYVLISMSLLLALEQQDYVTMDEVREIIEAVGTKGELRNTAQLALNDAMNKFRRNLEQSDRIQLVDVDRTRRRLEALELTYFDLGQKIPVPFQDAEGVLSIDFAYPPYHSDSIELSSLFADVLEFQPPSESNSLTGIYEVLERWKQKSAEVEDSTLPEAAKRVLEMCEDEGKPIREALTSVAAAYSTLNEEAVIRLAMEFAWVKAWYEELTDHEEYRQSRKRKPSLIYRVHSILGLIDMQERFIYYRRLLAETVKKKDEVSNEPWRGPFKKEWANTNDAYQLNIDAPSALTPLERSLCIQYAQDELGWDGARWPYPRWMTE